jgi:hypothetical protein
MHPRPFPVSRNSARRQRSGAKTLGHSARTILQHASALPAGRTMRVHEQHRSVQQQQVQHDQQHPHMHAHGSGFETSKQSEDYASMMLPPPNGAPAELSAPASSASTSVHSQPPVYPQFHLNFELPKLFNIMKQNAQPLMNQQNAQLMQTQFHQQYPFQYQPISQQEQHAPASFYDDESNQRVQHVQRMSDAVQPPNASHSQFSRKYDNDEQQPCVENMQQATHVYHQQVHEQQPTPSVQASPAPNTLSSLHQHSIKQSTSPQPPLSQQYKHLSIRQQVGETPVSLPHSFAMQAKPIDMLKAVSVNPYDNDSDNFESDNEDPPPLPPRARVPSVQAAATVHTAHAITTTTATTTTEMREHPTVPHTSSAAVPASRQHPSELITQYALHSETHVASSNAFDDSKTVATHALPRTVSIIRDPHGSVRVVGEFGTHRLDDSSSAAILSTRKVSVDQISTLRTQVQKTNEASGAQREKHFNDMLAKIAVSSTDHVGEMKKSESEMSSQKLSGALAAYRPSHQDSTFLEVLLRDSRMNEEKPTDEKKKNVTNAHMKKQSERTRLTLADVVVGFCDVQKRIKHVSPFMATLLKQHTSKKESVLLPPSVSYTLSNSLVYDYAFQWCGPDNVIVNPGSLAEDVGRVHLTRLPVNSSVAISGMHTLTVTSTLADAVQMLPLTLQYWEIPAEAKNKTPTTPITTTGDYTDNLPVVGIRVLKAALYDSNHNMLYIGAVKEYPLMQLQKQNVDKSVLCCDVPVYENTFFMRLSFMPSVDLNNHFGFTIEYMPILKKETPSNLLKHIKIHCNTQQHC